MLCPVTDFVVQFPFLDAILYSHLWFSDEFTTKYIVDAPQTMIIYKIYISEYISANLAMLRHQHFPHFNRNHNDLHWWARLENSSYRKCSNFQSITICWSPMCGEQSTGNIACLAIEPRCPWLWTFGWVQSPPTDYGDETIVRLPSGQFLVLETRFLSGPASCCSQCLSPVSRSKDNNIWWLNETRATMWNFIFLFTNINRLLQYGTTTSTCSISILFDYCNGLWKVINNQVYPLRNSRKHAKCEHLSHRIAHKNINKPQIQERCGEVFERRNEALQIQAQGHNDTSMTAGKVCEDK